MRVAINREKAFDIKGFAEAFGEAFDARGFVASFRSGFDATGGRKSFELGFKSGADQWLSPIRWMRSAVQQNDEPSPADRVRLYDRLAVEARERGDYNDALDLYRKSLAIKEQLGDRTGIANSYDQLGNVARERGDYDDAFNWYQKALTIKKQLGDRVGMANSCDQLGIVARERSDYDDALHWYRQSLRIKRRLRDRAGMSSSYDQLGIVAQERGDYDDALDWYRRSLAIKGQLGDRAGMVSTLGQTDDLCMEMWVEAGRVPIDLRNTTLRLEISAYYGVLKRLIDLLISANLIVTLLPLLVMTALIVLFDVGWPVFFWQQRTGRCGRELQLYKLRTLRPPFDRSGQRIPEGQRLSGIGRLLRKTRFDELPQLFNVLVGDMSLIGPRPLLPRDQPPNSDLRLTVRPGITGWAQVNGDTLLSPTEKDALDLWYIRNASLWLDLRIIGMTFLSLVRDDRRSEKALAQALQGVNTEDIPTIFALLDKFRPGRAQTEKVLPLAEDDSRFRGFAARLPMVFQLRSMLAK